jgi:hypothetical protein
MSLLPAAILAGAVAAASTAGAPPARDLYRLELTGNQTIWSQDRPVASGSLILFHRFPDGVLLSVRGTDVRRIVVSKYQAPSVPALSPGGVVDLGTTGSGSAAVSAGGAPRSTGAGPLPPGERKDGTALLNPDRSYRPEWDSKQVPGMNIAYPASSNDYREGKTFAYPPAAATQAVPGDVPRARVETGEPAKAPSQ